MEWILVICNIIQVPLFLFTITAVPVGFGVYFAYITEDDGDTDMRYKIAGKRLWVTAMLLLPLTCASFVPQALISSRVQMIKLEITDPGVRKQVYENVDRIFGKLEEKYLGTDNSKGEDK